MAAYRTILKREIALLEIRCNTLFEGLNSNPYADTFDITLEKYKNLLLKKKAKEDALRRINYPAINKRINSTYVPQ